MVFVSEYDVRCQLILTNFFKQRFLEGSFEEKGVYEIRSEVDSFDLEEVDYYSQFVGWNIPRYGEFSWTKQEVSLDEIGSWPGMQGLPFEFTRGSISELSDKIGLPFSAEIPINLKRNLLGIIERLDFTMQNFLPILLPGGHIRERDPLAKRLDYDCWDGNTRLLAYSLSGIDNVLAYVSKEK